MSRQPGGISNVVRSKSSVRDRRCLWEEHLAGLVESMASKAVSPEEAFVRSFVVADERRRLLWLLKQGRRRRDFLDRLNVGVTLDPRFARLLQGRESLHTGIESLLHTKGAPDHAYVVAQDPELDGRELPLSDAIQGLIDTTFGGLISCIPGRLVYYQREAPTGSYLLERP